MNASGTRCKVSWAIHQGKDLNVRYVLDGSVQRADQNVRVTAQLIDATTGRQIWADRYDRQVDNIFAIRDDITRSIAGTLGSIAGVVSQTRRHACPRKIRIASLRTITL